MHEDWVKLHPWVAKAMVKDACKTVAERNFWRSDGLVDVHRLRCDFDYRVNVIALGRSATQLPSTRAVLVA
jgi:hypothetical protein